MKRHRALFSILAASLVLSAGACGLESPATCGAAPGRPIVGFVVTTVTGDNPTDANIHFCYTRKSGGAEECHNLDNLFENDFKSHAVDSFRWSLPQPIAPGDLERFVIRNAGGGFLGSDWKMAALNVSAVLDDGRGVSLYEVEFSGDGYLDKGDSYDSSQCGY